MEQIAIGRNAQALTPRLVGGIEVLLGIRNTNDAGGQRGTLRRKTLGPAS